MSEAYDRDLSALIAEGASVNLPVPDTDVPMVSRSLRLPVDVDQCVRAAADARGIGVTTLMRGDRTPRQLSEGGVPALVQAVSSSAFHAEAAQLCADLLAVGRVRVALPVRVGEGEELYAARAGAPQHRSAALPGQLGDPFLPGRALGEVPLGEPGDGGELAVAFGGAGYRLLPASGLIYVRRYFDAPAHAAEQGTRVLDPPAGPLYHPDERVRVEVRHVRVDDFPAGGGQVVAGVGYLQVAVDRSVAGPLPQVETAPGCPRGRRTAPGWLRQTVARDKGCRDQCARAGIGW